MWYRFTPAVDLNLFADTFGTGYAAVLGVFTGPGLASLQTVGCDTSAAGNAQVGFPAGAGHTYWFQITGPAGGGSLTFDLAATLPTTRVDVSSTGEQADGLAGDPAQLSVDGSVVGFYSQATNLGGSCTTAPCGGIFVRDHGAGRTETVASVQRQSQAVVGGGSYVNGPDLWTPGLSDDGRYVVFHSDWDGFVPGDTNGDYDVFLYDRMTHQYERASLATNAREGHAPPVEPDRAPYSANESNFPGSKFGSVSADGRYVAFTSDAPDLVQGDANGANDVFVRDRFTGRTELVSIAPAAGQMARAETKFGRAISADGRYVTFMAWTSVPPTPIGHATAGQALQIYVRDRLKQRTMLVSRSVTGGGGNADSYWPSVSADGSHVVFTSEAADLVRDDTNGATCTRSGVDTCGVDFFSFAVATGRLVRVSVNSDGRQQSFVERAGGQLTNYPQQPIAATSGDGRLVAFATVGVDLVPGDTNNKEDVFVHDLLTGATVRVSVSSRGTQGNDDSYAPVISADGSTVSFISSATNLVEGDTNGTSDVFLHALT